MDERFGVVIVRPDGVARDTRYFATETKAETWGMLHAEEGEDYLFGRVVQVITAGAVTEEIIAPIVKDAGALLVEHDQSSAMNRTTCIVHNASPADFTMNMMLNLGANFRATRR